MGFRRRLDWPNDNHSLPFFSRNLSGFSWICDRIYSSPRVFSVIGAERAKCEINARMTYLDLRSDRFPFAVCLGTAERSSKIPFRHKGLGTKAMMSAKRKRKGNFSIVCSTRNRETVLETPCMSNIHFANAISEASRDEFKHLLLVPVLAEFQQDFIMNDLKVDISGMILKKNILSNLRHRYYIRPLRDCINNAKTRILLSSRVLYFWEWLFLQLRRSFLV